MSTATAIAPSYLALLRSFPLRPLRSKSDYDAAAEVLDRLVVRDESSLDDGEKDYLETLELLIERYDERHFQLRPDKRTPVRRLKHLMQQTEMTQARLQALLGVSQSLVSLILSGKRELSKPNIRRLAEHFRVDAGYFL
jgi:HTH-type transcriptional regulator/antitoxin HigA